MAQRGKPVPAFSGRKPLIVTLRAPIVRIHRRAHVHDFFGRTGTNRFDAPDHSYGVFYAGTSLEAAFSETFLRDPPKDAVSLTDLAQRWRTTIEHDPLRLVQAYGKGLNRLGATAEIGDCPYDISQTWSKAIHEHPKGVDGILWVGRHDNTTRSIALFERARAKLKAHKQEEFDKVTIASLRRRWLFKLI